MVSSFFWASKSLDLLFTFPSPTTSNKNKDSTATGGSVSPCSFLDPLFFLTSGSHFKLTLDNLAVTASWLAFDRVVVFFFYCVGAFGHVPNPVEESGD